MKNTFKVFLRAFSALALCVTILICSCITPLAITLEGDISADGALNANDLTMLRKALLSMDSDLKYDINGDNAVNLKDLVNLKKKVAYYYDGEKFLSQDLTQAGNAKAIALGSIFGAKEGMDIDSALVKFEVEVLSGDVTYTYNADSKNWADGTVDFDGTGEVNVTICEYCKPTTVKIEVVNETKFKVNETVAESYGNASIITVGTIFSAIEGYEIDSSRVCVTYEVKSGDVTCQYEYDSINWQEGKLEFDGTGEITLTIIEESLPTSVTLTIVKGDKFKLKVDDPYHIYNNEVVHLDSLFEILEGVDCDIMSIDYTIEKVDPDSTLDWTVNSMDVWSGTGIDFTGEGQATITVEEDSNPITITIVVDLIEKLEPIENVEVDLKVSDCIYLGQLFNEIGVEPLDSASLEVLLNGEVYSGTLDYSGWRNTFIQISDEGTYTVTVRDKDSKPATATFNVVYNGEKFAVKFPNTKSYLYRVGNQNEIKLGSLFEAIAGAPVDSADVSVLINSISGNTACTYTANTNDWTVSAVKFTGTGTAEIIIKENCNETVLTVEVVDATNATSAMSATAKNVVLLNDVNFSTIEVSNGYSLYGNGFTMTCSSDSAVLDMGYSFVALNNGTLDNVQIVCPNFDYAALYKSNLTSSDNRSETDSNGKIRYYNAKSGVMTSGNSQILNSRITGGRAALNVSGGNIVVDNSRIELGAVASVLVGGANSLLLRDVTLIQKPTVSTFDSSKTLMGFSVLYLCDSDGNATPTTIEGGFIQQAWIDENDSQYVPSAGKDIVSTVLKETDYLHDIDGDGTDESLNLGFAYMPEDATKTVSEPTNITDNRTDKAIIPYEMKDVSIRLSIVSTTVYVYSYKNTNGTVDSFKNETQYSPNRNCDIITVSYSDTTDGITTGKFYGTNGWIYELNVDLDKASGYALDFSKLVMSVNGVTVTDFKVDGNSKPTTPITVTAGGTTYILTATIGDKDYVATYKVTGTETSKESPSLVGTPSYKEGFGVANNYGGDWSAAAPVLEGITVKYWSVADSEYKEFDLSSITFANTGKQNGTNNYWEYTHTNNDFTLKLTNSAVMHSNSSTYGMPVAGKDGKLYFTISSSAGFVSTGTTSRSIAIAYEFTDNNGGDTLKFSNTWSVLYSKDEQYNYSSFTSDGTLTKLETGSGGGCVTPDTLVTLADGSQKRVDELTGEEMLLVWNLETGKLDCAPIMFIDSDPQAEYEVIKLYFSDGTEVKVISEHGFWDYDFNKYVYLDRNAEKYIGHTFAKQNGDELKKVTLIDVVIEKQTITAWSPVTVGHLCYFVNGMLSMPGGVGGLFNIFDVDAETMTYDYVAIERDIATFGVYTYEELNAIAPLSKEMFEAAGGIYLKISIGKGNMTIDELVTMIERYSKYI